MCRAVGRADDTTESVIWDSFAYYFLLTVESVFGVFGIRLSEEASYQTISHVGDRIEVRQYAPIMAAEVTIPYGDAEARNKAFRILFGYISADNSTASGADRVAMTVPVALDEPRHVAMTVPVQASSDRGTMRFFLPAKYRPETPPPKPLDARVQIVSLPAKTVAVLRYSGSGRNSTAKEQDLMKALQGTDWRPQGQPYTLYYDPPFTIPFLRRNEAAVAVAKASTAPPR